MKESILRYIQKCPKCGSAYIEEIGEVCRCPLEKEVNEELLSKWQTGEHTL